MKRKDNRSVEKCKLLYRFKKQGIAWAMLIPFLACLILFVWQPNIQGIILSFFNLKGYEPIDFCGFKNYEIVIKNTNFISIKISFFSFFRYIYCIPNTNKTKKANII